MDSLFIFTSDLSVELNPDAKKLTKYLHKVNADQFKYIILAYDYRYSKYKAYPPSDMKMFAQNEIFGKSILKPEDNELVSKAIEEYIELNYDELREDKKAYQQKIKELRTILLQPGELAISKLKSIRENISYLEEEILKIERKISVEDDHLLLKGGKKLSTIELWQRRQKKRRELSGA